MPGTWPNLDASDLETRVRTYLDEVSADFYSQAEIWRWLSIAVKDIAQNTLCVRRALDAVTTAATRTVSFIGYKCFHVEYIPSSGRPTMLTKISPLQTGHFPLNNGIVPQYWYEFGNTIGIDPLPTTAYNLRLYIADIPKMLIATCTSFGSGWTGGTGWTGAATADHTGASSGDLTYTTAALTQYANYSIQFTVSGIGTGGTVTPYIGTTAGVAVTTNGYHCQNIYPTSATPSLIFTGNNTLSLDDVYIYKEVDYAAVGDQTELPCMWQHLLALYATYNGLIKSKRLGPAQMLASIYSNEIMYLRHNVIEIIPDGKDSLIYK
jgi:hypothetical protein